MWEIEQSLVKGKHFLMIDLLRNTSVREEDQQLAPGDPTLISAWPSWSQFTQWLKKKLNCRTDPFWNCCLQYHPPAFPLCFLLISFQGFFFWVNFLEFSGTFFHGGSIYFKFTLKIWQCSGTLEKHCLFSYPFYTLTPKFPLSHPSKPLAVYNLYLLYFSVHKLKPAILFVGDVLLLS